MGLRVGDAGCKITRAFVDETGAVVDISSAVTKEMWFAKGDNSTTKKAGEFVTNGTDGLLKYTFVAGDLSIGSTWRNQGYVVLANGETYHTSIYEFVVDTNIIAT